MSAIEYISSESIKKCQDFIWSIVYYLLELGSGSDAICVTKSLSGVKYGLPIPNAYSRSDPPSDH